MDAEEDDMVSRAVHCGFLSQERFQQAREGAEREGTTLVEWLKKLGWIGEEQFRRLREDDSLGVAEGHSSQPLFLPPEVTGAMQTGSTQLGKYVIIERIGHGGAGTVWKAWDTVLLRWVALKIPDRVCDEKARLKTMAEARIAARLKHPGLVAIYDAGEIDGRPYVAMNLVTGRPLACDLGPREAADLIRKVAEAMGVAHVSGVVHRDLKPRNILVDERGEPCVVDFGLAIVEQSSRLGRRLKPAGTPLYMSPEQFESDRSDVTPRSDVYGLGAVLYELLTGRPPHSAESIPDLMRCIRLDSPVAPRSIRPDIPSRLQEIVLRCLRKAPEERFADGGELAEALRRWLDTDVPAGAARRRRGRLAWWNAWGAAAALFVAAAAIAYASTRSPRPEREANPPPPRSPDRLQVIRDTLRDRDRALRTGQAEPNGARRDIGTALVDLDAYIADFPSDPMGLYVRASARHARMDLGGAEKDLRAAVDLAPDCRPAWSLLGAVLLEDFIDHLMLSCVVLNEARNLGDAVESWSSRRDSAENALARGYRAGSERDDWIRWKLAWTYEDQVLAGFTCAIAETYMRGDAVAFEDRAAEAEKHFKSEYYSWWRGRIASTPLEGIAHYTEALNRAPGFARGHLLRGVARMMIGDLAQATADMENAVVFGAETAGTHYWKAMVLTLRGQQEAAIPHLRKAVALDSTFAEAHWLLASITLSAGDPTEAIRSANQALALRSDFADALEVRARAWHALRVPLRAAGDLDAALKSAWPHWPHRARVTELKCAWAKSDPDCGE
ncbi:MAG: protein kinase [Planctomycetes bacterium]|nr:protein kinase [Planctomycetota bacterium]